MERNTLWGENMVKEIIKATKGGEVKWEVRPWRASQPAERPFGLAFQAHTAERDLVLFQHQTEFSLEITERGSRNRNTVHNSRSDKEGGLAVLYRELEAKNLAGVGLA